MKNVLWYLGFLSVVSVLYFIEGKTVFLWFLSFIPYFAMYNLSDERLEQIVGRATRNAFMFSIFFGVGMFVYIYLTNSSIELFAPAFVFLLGGGLMVCLFSVFYYDRVGK
jgi:hypothetical protein